MPSLASSENGDRVRRCWSSSARRVRREVLAWPASLLAPVSDRFDLTLECIRRHYSDRASPLGVTLSRYTDFFALFGDFRGYVGFFLLDDLVTEALNVKFFMPFDDFRPPSVPKDVDTYKEYRCRAIEFIEARN